MKHGRIVSDETVYSSAYPIKGILNVDVSITAYKTSAGAHWIYDFNVASVHGAKEHGRPVVKLALARVGTESSALTVDFHRGSFHYRNDLVAFRRHAFFVTMQVGGLNGLYKPSVLLHLARIVDGRIAKLSH